MWSGEVQDVKICSREYALRFRKGNSGACFYSNGPDTNGNGVIEIGDYKDLEFVCGIIIHELVEAILYEDGRRYCPPVVEGDHSRYLFCFDHDYLDGFQNKVLDALLTSGFFRLVDRRPKVAKKKGGKKKGCK